MNDVLHNLKASIYARRSEGVDVPRTPGKIDTWSARVNDCYGNVAYWVERFPADLAVFGYLYNRWRAEIYPHAVVERDGELLDITPSADPSFSLPFIRHTGSEEEFAAAVIEKCLVL